jgi:type I restriction enzyme M protein
MSNPATYKNNTFYNMENDGLSVDDKRNPIDKNDIPDILEKFRSKEKPTDRKTKCFIVPATEIEENELNLSFSAYQEIEYEEREYEDPNKIVEKIMIKEDEIKYNVDEIKKIMRQ